MRKVRFWLGRLWDGLRWAVGKTIWAEVECPYCYRPHEVEIKSKGG